MAKGGEMVISGGGANKSDCEGYGNAIAAVSPLSLAVMRRGKMAPVSTQLQQCNSYF